MLFQLICNKGNGQLRGINRDIYIFEYIRQRTDMVLMSMSDHKAFYFGNILF